MDISPETVIEMEWSQLQNIVRTEICGMLGRKMNLSSKLGFYFIF